MNDNIQAGVVKPHGRNYTLYLIGCFRPLKDAIPREISSAQRGRIFKFISDLADEAVTSHIKQTYQTFRYNQFDDSSSVLTIAFSFDCLSQVFKLDRKYIPNDVSYAIGMVNPVTKDKLGDYKVKDLASSFDFNKECKDRHFCISISASSIAEVNETLKGVEMLMFPIREEVKIYKEYGFAGRNDDSQDGFKCGLYGFREGMADLRSEEEIFSDVFFDEARINDSLPVGFGTFQVVRKIEAKLENYEKLRGKTQEMLKQNKYSEGFADAWLMGRFRNGMPLALGIENANLIEDKVLKELESTHKEVLKADIHGLRCPYHAHVRKMNPRDGVTEAPKMVRRSKLYAHPEKFLNERGYENAEGMIFVSMQKDIGRDFEDLFQRQNIPPFDTIGYSSSRTYVQEFPTAFGKPYEQKSRVEVEPQVNKFKGGQYFYLPSTTFLSNLNLMTIDLEI